MIFLDANAFYSYIGRKNLGLIESNHVNEGEFARFLDSVNDKSIPTTGTEPIVRLQNTGFYRGQTHYNFHTR